jgi:site-specific recombinase XerD
MFNTEIEIENNKLQENIHLIENTNTNTNKTSIIPNNAIQYTFECIINAWLNSQASDATKRSYKNSIKDYFKTDIGNLNLDIIKMVTIIDVQNYIDELVSKKYKSSTIKAKISGVSSLYEYLLAFRSNTSYIALINHNPFNNAIIQKEKLKKVTTNDAKSTEILTDEEIKSLYDVIDLTSKNGIRDYAIIKLMLNTGLRRNEIVNLKIKDIYVREKEYWIYVNEGKGNKNRTNFINNETVDSVVNYLSSTKRKLNKSEDYIFKGNSRNNLNGDKMCTNAIAEIIEKYRKEANIEKDISPHSLRHTTATTLIESGVDLKIVGEFLGHASINTTMKYYHNMKKIQNNAGRSINL